VLVFEGFEKVKDEQSRKRWFASTGTSLIILVVVGIGVAFLAKQQVQKASAEPEIDVSFSSSPEPEEAKKEPPPPPPPPPPKTSAPKKRPGKAAPVQPTVIPEQRPSEAIPTGDREAPDEIEEFGDGELGGGIAETPAPPPPPPPPPVVDEKDEPTPDPIDEIDTAFARAEPMPGNEMPVYPEVARIKGTEAHVRLKVRISAAGDVTDVEVLSGDEPFASAAVAAVRTWRWRPATDDGTEVASTRVVDIPFRLQSR
jgi:protein TonB